MIFSTLTRFAKSSTLRNRELSEDTHEAVRLLPPEQMDGRLRKLHEACILLADGFEAFDEHIAAYVACTPAPTGRSHNVDADRFLDWLETRVDLSDEQRDCVTALRSRQAVEFVAVKQRLAHARFQELLMRNARHERELESNRRLTLRINPIHVWSQFETRVLLAENAEVPATVLFFPVGASVRTLVIEPDAETLLRDLESGGAMTMADLLRRTPRDQHSECISRVRKLAAMGVIAIGS